MFRGGFISNNCISRKIFIPFHINPTRYSPQVNTAVDHRPSLLLFVLIYVLLLQLLDGDGSIDLRVDRSTKLF
jgi:hypothetical protein